MTGPGPSALAAVLLAGLAGAALVPSRVTVLARLAGRAQFRRRRGPVVGALRRRADRRAADRRREAVGDLLSALVAELRSGADPRSALRAAATGLGGLEPVVAAASRPAGAVAAALAAAATEPGGSTLRELAAAWRVSDLTGCGLAAPVARVLVGHQAQDRLRREVAAQLAGPRATATLLSALPLCGIALSVALGADPVRFLVGSTVGRLVLVVGVALVVAGAVWTRRITTAATAGFVAEPEAAS